MTRRKQVLDPDTIPTPESLLEPGALTVRPIEAFSTFSRYPDGDEILTELDAALDESIANLSRGLV